MPYDRLEIWSRPAECPDCRGRTFEFGPRGGAAHNIRCTKCGTWWNAVFHGGSGLIERLSRERRRETGESAAAP